MRAISLSLISPMIFSIILAQKCLSFEFAPNYFPFCRKKTKESYKTADEPLENTIYDPDFPDLQFIDEYTPKVIDICKVNQPRLGELFISETVGTTDDNAPEFLRREYDPRMVGYYYRPYEEEFENRNFYRFVPFMDSHKYNKYNKTIKLKQDYLCPPPPKTLENHELPKKEELPVEQKLPKTEELSEEEILSTIYGENEEICEQNKHLLCTDPEETINAINLMTEAITHLEKHVADKDGYELCKIYDFYGMALYKKKHEGYTIHKIRLNYYNLNKYNETINELWYPARGNSFKTGSTKKKIVRVHTPNLVMIQQRYKTWPFGRQRYFYALAAKVEVSKNRTAIVMTSPNINDHNPYSKEYKNTIIENANLFKADIDSEKDIRKGKLKKTFINIAGYIIEKKTGYVDVTYIESVSDIQILIT
ncbi:hypothetical protein YYE_03982 [Plasmodium vinckei vinckei]|uniref:Fam-a protein n=1 Tax=Plasmodium vinckei vinckei TaxID=54757 RepID=A0A081ICI4_PLAVN|nr:hypothetical protein YYE_03982 [Plasmodium vinckei vinckei]